MAHNIRPVMRVPSSFYPKIIGSARLKPLVALTMSSDQARQVRKLGVDATAGTAVRLRVINSTVQNKNIHETRMVIGLIPFSIILLTQTGSLDFEWPPKSGREIGETTDQFALH